AIHKAYNMHQGAERKGFSSDQTIIFQNYAISQKRDRLIINSINDLSDKRVLAFQDATAYLGPAFAEMAGGNPNYVELANQSLHVRMLSDRRVDVLISDKRIFLWWQKQFRQSIQKPTRAVDQSVVFHPLFPPSPRRVVFIEEKMRDDFNLGLQRLKASGRFEEIIRTYIGGEHNQ
ncbi:transporter substrate-binding domain-containing protein, partial [Pseudodesulfovibrio sp.]|nr:transporter substrate-binding domain-containing protein [Pseudodesulfovibrio sp.]